MYVGARYEYILTGVAKVPIGPQIATWVILILLCISLRSLCLGGRV